MRNVKDAEANDMIHMGSDHRCVMSTFLIDMLEGKNKVRKGNTKQEKTMYAEQKDKPKKTTVENLNSKKDIRK